MGNNVVVINPTQFRAPLFEFNLESPVEDVQWAPYSSTVFGAVTKDGFIRIYDLDLNKYNSICTQMLVRPPQNTLSSMQFNWKLPLIVVGDGRYVN
jgi:dynein intermediate chain 1